MSDTAQPAVESGDALLSFDSDMRVVDWNEAFEQLVELSPEEIWCGVHKFGPRHLGPCKGTGSSW